MSDLSEFYASQGIKRGACKLCGEGIWLEREYEKMGICAACVRRTANEFWKAHAGEPLQHFCSPDEWKLHLQRMAEWRAKKSPKAVIAQSLRTLVFERDEYACTACGARKNLTVDHKHPELHGGTLDPDNLQTLCRSCNSRKGSRVA